MPQETPASCSMISWCYLAMAIVMVISIFMAMAVAAAIFIMVADFLLYPHRLCMHSLFCFFGVHFKTESFVEFLSLFSFSISAVTASIRNSIDMVVSKLV
jgi:hypothetical protein